MKKIKEFLREIFAPKVTIYNYKSDNLTEAQRKHLEKAFEKMDEAFKEMNKAINK